MSKKEQEEKEEEEALSLCDLPVMKITKDEIESSDQTRLLESQEEEENEFEFGSWRADSLEPNMCAAEDVFFQGQLLPLRLSLSSDSGILRDSKCVWRSESMDRNGYTYTHRRKELEWNHFHAHPSPRPQIWQTANRPGNGGVRSRKSTVWGFFRLGLLRTPEIELQDLKLKLWNRNKSCGSSSGSSSKNSKGEGETKLKTTLNRLKVSDGFSGCKCSVSAVETIRSRIPIIKKVRWSGSGREEKEPNEEQKMKQEKQAMAHRRTFDWLKQLSLAVADLPWDA
ncbi:uncharacterized protein LOC122073709 [Macadamia integrifolia]|uniref:uncharacterized protein LOC122073709 n=1 Tax=Macadamia integrifolia TaxID=60698 RepID=UPI001C4F9D5D|nr:uncharacterized protein LOC122073709 [Macadamia integrifolia]